MGPSDGQHLAVVPELPAARAVGTDRWVCPLLWQAGGRVAALAGGPRPSVGRRRRAAPGGHHQRPVHRAGHPAADRRQHQTQLRRPGHRRRRPVQPGVRRRTPTRHQGRCHHRLLVGDVSPPTLSSTRPSQFPLPSHRDDLPSHADVKQVN